MKTIIYITLLSFVTEFGPSGIAVAQLGDSHEIHVPAATQGLLPKSPEGAPIAVQRDPAGHVVSASTVDSEGKKLTVTFPPWPEHGWLVLTTEGQPSIWFSATDNGQRFSVAAPDLSVVITIEPAWGGGAVVAPATFTSVITKSGKSTKTTTDVNPGDVGASINALLSEQFPGFRNIVTELSPALLEYGNQVGAALASSTKAKIGRAVIWGLAAAGCAVASGATLGIAILACAVYGAEASYGGDLIGDADSTDSGPSTAAGSGASGSTAGSQGGGGQQGDSGVKKKDNPVQNSTPK